MQSSKNKTKSLTGVKLFRNSTIPAATFQTEVINHYFQVKHSKFHAKSMTIAENFHSTPTTENKMKKRNSPSNDILCGTSPCTDAWAQL